MEGISAEPRFVKIAEAEWGLQWGDSEVKLLMTDEGKKQVRLVKKGIMVTTWPSVGFSIQQPR